MGALFLVSAWLFWVGSVQDTGKIDLLFFYDKGCPHCGRVEDFLEKRLVQEYPVRVTRLEIHQPENAEKMIRLARALKAGEVLKNGTPAVFIGREAFQGDSRAVLMKIEAALRRAMRERPPPSLTFLPQESTAEKLGKDLTLPAVIGAAAADSVNPCAFAVLILLLGTILMGRSGSRKKVITAGISFTSACFISYFLMGFGLLYVIRFSGLQRMIYGGTAILALFLGLWNLKDAFWYGKGPAYHVPRGWQKRARKLAEGIRTVPGAFFTGMAISIFLLPCTSGPYVVIIGLLGKASTRWSAAMYLVIYNLVFVVPFLLITLLVGAGTVSAERMERWRTEHLPLFNGIAGAVLMVIGGAMLILVFLDKV